MKLGAFVIASIFTAGLISIPAIADDNIAACEIVVMRPVIEIDPSTGEENLVENTPMVARFYPAADFIFSVFSGEKGPMREVDGQPIRAVMCTRNNVIPTEFDLKIIRTGIPLHLSQNFDSSDSSLLSIRKQDGVYVHTYSGADLAAENKEVLKIRLDTLNEATQEVMKEIVKENADN